VLAATAVAASIVSVLVAGTGTRAGPGAAAVSPGFVAPACHGAAAATVAEVHRHAADGRCSSILADGVSLRSLAWEGPYGLLPVQAVGPARVEDVQRVVLYLHGGPFGTSGFRSWSSQLGAWQKRAAREGTLFLNPFYLGSAERSVFPESDIRFALEELAFLYKELRRGSDKPVVIVGSSTGGYLAAALAGRVQAPSAVLLSPIIISPRELLARDLDGENPRVLPNIYKPFSQYRLAGDRLVYVGVIKEAVPSLNRAFFRDHADRPLAALVRSARGTSFHLLLGREDDLIGIEHADTLRGLSNASLVVLDGYWHRPRSAEQHAHWYAEVDRLILAASKRD